MNTNEDKIIEYLEKENSKLKEENNKLYKRIGELEFQLKTNYNKNDIPSWEHHNITCGIVKDYEPEDTVIKVNLKGVIND